MPSDASNASDFYRAPVCQPGTTQPMVLRGSTRADVSNSRRNLPRCRPGSRTMSARGGTTSHVNFQTRELRQCLPRTGHFSPTPAQSSGAADDPRRRTTHGATTANVRANSKEAGVATGLLQLPPLLLGEFRCATNAKQLTCGARDQSPPAASSFFTRSAAKVPCARRERVSAKTFLKAASSVLKTVIFFDMRS